nr:(d)CMP kinase [Nitrosomonas sp.]
MQSLIGNQHSTGRILIIGGVSGSGKSTVGKALAKRLSWPFIEGDM